MRFYAFPLTAPAITAAEGWSPVILSLGFSASLLIAGLTAPSVATQLQRRGGRTVLTAGSMIGALALAGVAAAPAAPALVAGLAIVGIAMAATLYEPAMAVLVALDPARRQRSLAAVTVAGGLASTVFGPLTIAMVDALGWRASLAAIAVAGGTVTAALHLALLRRRARAAPHRLRGSPGASSRAATGTCASRSSSNRRPTSPSPPASSHCSPLWPCPPPPRGSC